MSELQGGNDKSLGFGPYSSELGEAFYPTTFNDLSHDCFVATGHMENFERALAENNQIEIKESSVACLGEFLTLMGRMEDSLNHPNDWDRLFKVNDPASLRENFVRLIEKIRRYNIIGRLREFKDFDVEYPELLNQSEQYLLKADIYLAGTLGSEKSR